MDGAFSDEELCRSEGIIPALESAHAVAHAVRAEKDLETVAALLQVPVFTFYDSLNRLALAGTCVTLRPLPRVRRA